VNLKRVARLMREAGIQGFYRRRRHGCTVRDPDAQPCADLVNRQFTVDAPNRLWITDITEHPTVEGRVYCAQRPHPRDRHHLLPTPHQQDQHPPQAGKLTTSLT
jgi:transposase InsO family protein